MEYLPQFDYYWLKEKGVVWELGSSLLQYESELCWSKMFQWFLLNKFIFPLRGQFIFTLFPPLPQYSDVIFDILSPVM